MSGEVRGSRPESRSPAAMLCRRRGESRRIWAYWLPQLAPLPFLGRPGSLGVQSHRVVPQPTTRAAGPRPPSREQGRLRKPRAAAFKLPRRERALTTVLMATGLTFDSIAALFSLTRHLVEGSPHRAGHRRHPAGVRANRDCPAGLPAHRPRPAGRDTPCLFLIALLRKTLAG